MSTDEAPSEASPQRSLVVWIVYALMGTLAVGFVVMIGVTSLYHHGPLPWGNRLLRNRPDPYEVLRTTAVVTGLLAGAIAATIAIRRQQSTEKSVELTSRAQLLTAEANKFTAQTIAREAAKFELDQVGRLRDRYTTVASQLGDGAPAVRLAGVYAMAALADEWLWKEVSTEAQVCIEILCSYIRTPRAGDVPGVSAGRSRSAPEHRPCHREPPQ